MYFLVCINDGEKRRIYKIETLKQVTKNEIKELEALAHKGLWCEPELLETSDIFWSGGMFSPMQLNIILKKEIAIFKLLESDEEYQLDVWEVTIGGEKVRVVAKMNANREDIIYVAKRELLLT